MGLFSKDIKSVEDLFFHGLEDIYYAEHQILKSLPKMIENAHNGELKRGLQQHLRETEGQVKRLEQVFKLNERDPRGTRCPAIDGILKEGDDLMGEIEGDEIMNVGITAAGQAVEHYEMTRYGALIAWARELGRESSVPLLRQNLQEEVAANQKLTALAESRLPPLADRGRTGSRAKSTTRRSKPSQGRKASPTRAAAARARKPAKKTTGSKRAR
jgi:ferritin-like metal-binding protein YciE